MQDEPEDHLKTAEKANVSQFTTIFNNWLF